jgi:hypothetical protein
MKNRFIFAPFLLLVLNCAEKPQKAEHGTIPVADSSVTGSPKPADPENPDLFSQVEGVWIDTEYDDKLRKTRSPIDALTNVPNISFYQEKGKPILFVNLAFHEGMSIPLKIVQAENGPVFQMEEDFTLDISNDGEEITLQSGNEQVLDKPTKFRRITAKNPASMEKEHDILLKYINEVVLQGEYEDEKGQFYRFTSNQEAVFPQEKFDYELITDAIGASCDGLYPKNGRSNSRSIGFKWKKNKLLLFDKQPDPKNPDGEICARKPFAELTKLK